MKWIDSYNSKVCTPQEAVKVIKSGMRVYVHPGCATPEVLLNAMCDNSDHLSNVEVIHILTFGISPYSSDPKMEGRFRHNALFIGGNVRKAVNEGRADFTPVFLYEIPHLFYKGILPIDVAIINVSPPDKYGYCSFGVGIECTKPATEVAKIIIAQINPQMPRTLGDSFIHIDKIDYCVEVDVPLNELKYEERKTKEDHEIYQKIGEYIAGLIEDGSTLQMGIGAIPEAVLGHLFEKKDLGIHTEMFSDGVIKLIEREVITNEKKTLHPGKIIASFVLGSKKLFDFIDNNPLMEFHPSHYTNDPFIIAQNEKMVAINSAIEIDLSGQVCSDSIGPMFYSGFGGQLDFIRGASRSKGGKPIIAIPSTTRNGQISKIVPYLSQGAGVTTSRGDVHYVVTEYGIADLYGKTIRQRAISLIDIAHPDFREHLDRFVSERFLKKVLV